MHAIASISGAYPEWTCSHRDEYLGYYGQLYFQTHLRHQSYIESNRLLPAPALRAHLTQLKPYGNFNSDKDYKDYIQFEFIGSYRVLDNDQRFFRIISRGGTS